MSMASASFSAKLALVDADVVRTPVTDLEWHRITTRCTYDALVLAARSRFNILPMTEVTLRYIDADGDVVHIVNTEDVEECARTVKAPAYVRVSTGEVTSWLWQDIDVGGSSIQVPTGGLSCASSAPAQMLRKFADVVGSTADSGPRLDLASRAPGPAPPTVITGPIISGLAPTTRTPSMATTGPAVISPAITSPATTRTPSTGMPGPAVTSPAVTSLATTSPAATSPAVTSLATTSPVPSTTKSKCKVRSNSASNVTIVVCVRNLSNNDTKEDVYTYFSKFGVVDLVEAINETYMSRRAYVHMGSWTTAAGLALQARLVEKGAEEPCPGTPWDVSGRPQSAEKMAYIAALKRTPLNEPSVHLPLVPKTRSLKALLAKLGSIDRIDEPRAGSMAFAHFKRWNVENPAVACLRLRLLSSSHRDTFTFDDGTLVPLYCALSPART